MDIHESPVTFLRYISDCPVDLIAALTLVGRNQRRQGVRLSNKVRAAASDKHNGA